MSPLIVTPGPPDALVAKYWVSDAIPTPVPPPRALLVEDNFNRANGQLVGSTTSDGLGVWQALLIGPYAGYDGTALKVTSNALESDQWNNERAAYVETNAADGHLQFDYVNGQANYVYGSVGFIARYDPVTQTFLRASWDAGNGGATPATFHIYEWHGLANPVFFGLASVAGVLVPGDVMSVDFLGSTVTLKVNEVTVITTSSSLYTTGTKHGVVMTEISNPSLPPNHRIDNFNFIRPASVVDNFNRVDSTSLGRTSDDTASWTQRSGSGANIGIVGNKARLPAATLGQRFATIPAASAGSVQVTVPDSTNSNKTAGLTFRYIDSTHYWLVIVDGVRFSVYDQGGAYYIGTGAAGDVIRVDYTTTDFTAYRNGVAVYSHTATQYNTGHAVGIYVNNADGTGGGSVDDFSYTPA